jgi:hypothetical protein
MWKLPTRLAAVTLIALGAAGCEIAKSTNPLSPSVAGPIPGVAITAPRMLEPGPGADISKDQQPIRLVAENATTTGVRPLTYTFEIATDAEFANKAFSQGGVPQGDGRTTVEAPVLDPERTYYWRARAEDGANTGPFAGAQSFRVRTPVVLEPPWLVAPPNGVTLPAGVAPVLIFGGSGRSGPVSNLRYTLQVSLNTSFTSVVAEVTVAEQPGRTSFTLSQALEGDTVYYWRARAVDDSTTGPWSGWWAFRTPALPGGGGGGGGGGGVPPARCYLRDGEALVNCIAAKYPERLVPTATLEERDRNMAFLRDRIIENGICGGLDLAWNLKRGVGPHSIDALAWRHDGIVEVVDIGQAYDDTSRTLRLQWALVGGTPGYDGYSPRPACN